MQAITENAQAVKDENERMKAVAVLYASEYIRVERRSAWRDRTVVKAKGVDVPPRPSQRFLLTITPFETQLTWATLISSRHCWNKTARKIVLIVRRTITSFVLLEESWTLNSCFSREKEVGRM